MERQAETVSCVVEAVPEPLQVSWTFASTRTLYTSVQVSCFTLAPAGQLDFRQLSWTFASTRTLYTSVKISWSCFALAP